MAGDQHARTLAVLGAALLATAVAGWGHAGGSTASGTAAERGAELYALHCAVCHGAQGAGDGEAAYLLSPAPRDFTQGHFRLASTRNGVPTDEDLLATLQRGMPGSAMPPWEWLPEKDLASLVLHVRRLAVEGKTRRMLEQARADEEDLAPEEAFAIAAEQLEPGEPIEVGEALAADPVLLQEGHRLFVKSCSLCHGTDGTGRGASEQWNTDGTPAKPRDFTAGVFKGGIEQADMVRRILAGMAGSPMPSTSLEPAQARSVAAYVASLIRPGAQGRAAQARRSIRAARVARVPGEPLDPAWQAAEAVYLPLMPLWWSGQRVEGVVLRALHDGRSLAVRLSWADASAEDEILGQESFSDAAALQWSEGPDPPLFTMGSKGRPCSIWQWKAAWERDRERVRDVADRYPSTPDDQYGFVDRASQALYRTATHAGNPQSLAERRTAGELLAAEGFGTLTAVSAPGAGFTARGAWADGYWDVVFVRYLAAAGAGDVVPAPERTTYLAAAVWDGAALDRNGQKSVTVWHTLTLER